VPLRVPFISEQEVERIAEAVLAEHHSSRRLPVPIEHIVESGYELHIVPCGGIEGILEAHGFLSSDLTTIYVDRDVYHHRVPHRVRSTVAHELGHLLLHADLYKGLRFDTVEEYLLFTDQLDQEGLSYYELHANQFMGRILVPRRELTAYVERKLKECGDKGLPVDPPEQHVVDFMVRGSAQEFCVSTKLIKSRLRKDGPFPRELLD